MDFWSRLVGGSKKSAKPSGNPNSPQVRLAHLKRVYNNLLQIWNNGDGVSADAFVAENVRLCIRRLAELLTDDQRGPTPHYCVQFTATSRILVTIVKVAAGFCEEGITHETLSICGLLIDNEEEAFLEDRAFADALPTFVETIRRSVPRFWDQDTESSMVEVLFGVASKIRLEPLILHAWFRPDIRDEDEEDELQDIPRKTRVEEFRLFYLLLYYVPSQGRSGEFARMGLLYLIESVAHSKVFEKWVIDGDMAAMMASGLGALFSQLSRKLAITYREDEKPAILRFSNAQPKEMLSDAEETTSAEYQSHLATFLSSLVFWQDLLDHCPSEDVKQTLLDHYQYLFLQQLLYPSLLESSDIDGGSAVAVFTYLRHILDSIDHPDLVRLTLVYLLGTQSNAFKQDEILRPLSKARRRKSELLEARLAKEGVEASPDLFNLADLILSSVRSSSEQTVTAALQLLSTMLRKQYERSLTSLLKSRQAHASDARRTVGGQEKEVETYLALAESIGGPQDLETSYERHLLDIRNTLETHPSATLALSLPTGNEDFTARELKRSAREALNSRILHSDSMIFKALIVSLESFFSHDIETNLSLTQVVIDLAACGSLRLEGWLITDPNKYVYQDCEDGQSTEKESPILDASVDTTAQEITTVQAIQASRREPSWKSEDVSPIFRVLDQLTQKVETFHKEVGDFDASLQECRENIETEDKDTLSLPSFATPSRRLNDSERTSPTRANAMGSISERLRSERALGGGAVPTGSSTPRGRSTDQQQASTPTLVSRLSHLGASPSKSLHSRSQSQNYSPAPSGANLTSTPTKGMATATTTQPALRPYSGALLRKIRLSSYDEGDGEGQIQHEAYLDSETTSLASSPSVLSDSTLAQTAEGGIQTALRRGTADQATGEVTVGHLLTNVIILQEFILELAAVVEVRGALFEEVRFM